MRKTTDTEFYIPIDGTKTPKFAGIATFMKLPYLALEDAEYVDIGLIGVPWDGGTTYRSGARLAPRQVRDASTFMRNMHNTLKIKPYELCNCADLGDANINAVNLLESLQWVEDFYHQVLSKDIVPLSVGGDHLVSLPILRALAKNQPVGMVHFDAHTDMFSGFSGNSSFSHGTPFYHAINEGLLDPKRIVQIGIRGSMYTEEDRLWGLEKGVRIIDMEECTDLGTEGILIEIKKVIGDDETYLSFDIDCLDPAFASGTGTPEIGGFTSIEAQHLIRGLHGSNLIGADLVEISPPYDQSSNTALVGATLLFEILCLLADRKQKRESVKKTSMEESDG
ncbi:guanidinopropionase [Bathymodiolus platifrons methanotrophic gill symbiont]|uniref:agmatinase n=1 Tax=Bathymodiolus platifrons methanotrophic gill symbiont TaxID=113268 RepID=UPI000B6F193E|nr:agmatinase [Bathymodiolus platifrons methanotrophic gill symbiont]GAW87474.1 guanidinopropionase [Bathymodiolus platifrons methanotrophic gill symbiont]GFO74914.1 guanidinopropionase [Bathymodiolus platifrons methanotrophic gill symbiont]